MFITYSLHNWLYLNVWIYLSYYNFVSGATVTDTVYSRVNQVWVNTNIIIPHEQRSCWGGGGGGGGGYIGFIPFVRPSVRLSVRPSVPPAVSAL